MTEKRFTQLIFPVEKLSEEFVIYDNIEDNTIIRVGDVVKFLNKLNDENEQLKQTIDDLTSEFEGYHKSLEKTKDYTKQFEVTSCPYEIRNNKSMDYYWLEHQGNVIGICNVLNEQSEKINELEKQIADDFNQSNCITVQKSVIADLRERNNRQAEQLDRLYCLIEAKDWRALTDILDDFKECEEQLLSEWRQY